MGTLLPSRVLAAVDKIGRDFIWGSSDEKRKIHLVRWESITKPKKEGRLGLSAAKPKNIALLAKLNWRLRMEKDQAWARVLWSKYANTRRVCS